MKLLNFLTLAAPALAATISTTHASTRNGTPNPTGTASGTPLSLKMTTSTALATSLTQKNTSSPLTTQAPTNGPFVPTNKCGQWYIQVTQIDGKSYENLYNVQRTTNNLLGLFFIGNYQDNSTWSHRAVWRLTSDGVLTLNDTAMFFSLYDGLAWVGYNPYLDYWASWKPTCTFSHDFTFTCPGLGLKRDSFNQFYYGTQLVGAKDTSLAATFKLIPACDAPKTYTWSSAATKASATVPTKNPTPTPTSSCSLYYLQANSPGHSGIDGQYVGYKTTNETLNYGGLNSFFVLGKPSQSNNTVFKLESNGTLVDRHTSQPLAADIVNGGLVQYKSGSDMPGQTVVPYKCTITSAKLGVSCQVPGWNTTNFNGIGLVDATGYVTNAWGNHYSATGFQLFASAPLTLQQFRTDLTWSLVPATCPK